MARDCHTVLRPSSRAEEKARVASRPRRRSGARGPVHLVRGAVHLARGAGLLAKGAGLAARAHVRSRSRPSATATHQPGRRYLVSQVFANIQRRFCGLWKIFEIQRIKGANR